MNQPTWGIEITRDLMNATKPRFHFRRFPHAHIMLTIYKNSVLAKKIWMKKANMMDMPLCLVKIGITVMQHFSREVT